jgi:hypothetical protein
MTWSSTQRRLHGIGPAGQAGTTTLLDTPYLVQEWELPTPVVLLSGDGHYWIALDYRVVDRPENRRAPGSTTRWTTSCSSRPTSGVREAPDRIGLVSRIAPDGVSA